MVLFCTQCRDDLSTIKSEPSPGGLTAFSGSSMRHESAATPGESVAESSTYHSASSPDEPTVHSTSGDIVVDAESVDQRNSYEQPPHGSAPVDSGTERGRASDSDDMFSVMHSLEISSFLF